MVEPRAAHILSSGTKDLSDAEFVRAVATSAMRRSRARSCAWFRMAAACWLRDTLSLNSWIGFRSCSSRTRFLSITRGSA
jgi:hypothetical protein